MNLGFANVLRTLEKNFRPRSYRTFRTYQGNIHVDIYIGVQIVQYFYISFIFYVQLNNIEYEN